MLIHWSYLSLVLSHRDIQSCSSAYLLPDLSNQEVHLGHHTRDQQQHQHGVVITWKYTVTTEEPGFDGLLQDCSNSNALAMELLQSCAKPSCYHLYEWFKYISKYAMQFITGDIWGTVTHISPIITLQVAFLGDKHITRVNSKPRNITCTWTVHMIYI